MMMNLNEILSRSLINETLDKIIKVSKNSTGIVPVINPGKQWAPIIVPIIFALLLIAGIFGNLIICYIILRHKYMQITPNLFIMNLALGNLLLLIFSAPSTAISYLLDTYPFGSLMCKIDQTSQNLTLGVTIFTLVALSYDRCTSIRDPIRCHTNKSDRTKRSRFGITFIWAIALVLCIPDAMFSTIHNHELSQTYETIENSTSSHYTYQVCYPYYKINLVDKPPLYMKIRILARFIIYFLIPMIIIGTFYIMIVIVLLRPFNYANECKSLVTQKIEKECKIEKDNENENENENHDKAMKKITSLTSIDKLEKKTKRNKKCFLKTKQLSINSVYDNGNINIDANDMLELKNMQMAKKTKKSENTSQSNKKLDPLGYMRTSTANYIVNRRHMKARLKIVKMVLFLVIMFILFCLPEHIYFIMWYFTKVKFNQALLIFRIMSSCAFYAHASIHAYVLFCLSSKFRYYGQSMILKCNEKLFARQSTISSIRNKNAANK